MGFFDTWKIEPIKAGKSMDTKALLYENISKQEKLLAGEKVTGVKGKPIRSWFKGGRFNPSVAIYSLFDGQTAKVEPGKEAECLAAFKQALIDGELDKYIALVAKKRGRA
jgi:hypothetical protein